MEHKIIIDKISENRNVFKYLLTGAAREEYLWRPAPEKWCLLEIVCHLNDEEQFDFQARTKHSSENKKDELPKIDPEGWVKSKSYAQQDYEKTLNNFLEERKKSVEWLNTLKESEWKNFFEHPKFGPLSAEFFLSNWLAHDYLHFRQITSLKYNYLKFISGENLLYAGEW